MSENEEIVADRKVEIPGMNGENVIKKVAVVEPETNVVVMNPANSNSSGGGQKEQADITGKREYAEISKVKPIDKVEWIVRELLKYGDYENVSDSVKAGIFGFDIADVSGSIRLFSDVIKRLWIKLDGAELYEEFQRIYDENVGKDKEEDKLWNVGRER